MCSAVSLFTQVPPWQERLFFQDPLLIAKMTEMQETCLLSLDLDDPLHMNETVIRPRRVVRSLVPHKSAMLPQSWHPGVAKVPRLNPECVMLAILWFWQRSHQALISVNVEIPVAFLANEVGSPFFYLRLPGPPLPIWRPWRARNPLCTVAPGDLPRRVRAPRNIVGKQLVGSIDDYDSIHLVLDTFKAPREHLLFIVGDYARYDHANSPDPAYETSSVDRTVTRLNTNVGWSSSASR